MISCHYLLICRPSASMWTVGGMAWALVDVPEAAAFTSPTKNGTVNLAVHRRNAGMFSDQFLLRRSALVLIWSNRSNMPTLNHAASSSGSSSGVASPHFTAWSCASWQLTHRAAHAIAASRFGLMGSSQATHSP